MTGDVNLASLDVSPDGAATLKETRDTLTRYVVFPSPEAADAMTLIVAATHAMPHLEFAARAVIKSPVRRCGKTRLLDVLAQLVARPLITTDISAAALVRSIPQDGPPPTLLLDEADATFGKALKGDEKAESLRGIINAGFGRDRPYRRWDATARRPENCPTFAMAILAGIGTMPDTIEDRAVIVSLRRKAPGETVAKYRIRRDKPKVTAIGDRLAGWVVPNAEKIAVAVPDMPGGLNDRAEDVWEALLAVADLAGGEWPQRARAAVVKLAGDAEAAAESDRLLADLCDVFGEQDKLHSETILADLHKISEAPWGDYYGRPLNARDLARLLKPYGVKATDVKIDGVTKRGYRRDHLHDPWARYLSPGRGGCATSATSATAQVSELDQIAGSTSEVLPATSPMPLTCEVAQVAEVVHTPYAGGPGTGQCAVCGQLLDPALVKAGIDTHPTCGPEPADSGPADPWDSDWLPEPPEDDGWETP